MVTIDNYRLETREDRERHYHALLMRTFGNSVDAVYFAGRQHEGKLLGQVAVDSIEGFRTVESLALYEHYVHE